MLKTKDQHLCLNIYRTLSALQGRKELTLYWCPGHSNVLKIKEVDKLAKQEADSHPASIQDSLPQRLSRVCQNTKQKALGQNQIVEPTKRYPFKTDPGSMHEVRATWDRGIVNLLFQLRSGNVPLNMYLFRIKRSAIPLCQYCKRPETVAHFLVFSPNYRQQKTKMH
ncbi:hypothetical protein O181_004630 [Austropuccinia psidii MF-1]|uniref:RNase H type-1 domain-containing protein n=1 Tax=Austropuccinia psidii MF-1 TaxID=1389203 RepID=A0A9Q3BGS8_9BASI|nr:hypothetical protein [Austropuccinia psidii MF-1]